MDKILITISGLAGLGFVYWFFLMRKEQSVEVENSVDITVEGGYKPEVITVKKGKSATLTFLRNDPTECLGEVVLSDFKVKKQLPLGVPVPITITPDQTGKFTYHCGMSMYHGTIIVKE